jgi:hypothetical protein
VTVTPADVDRQSLPPARRPVLDCGLQSPPSAAGDHAMREYIQETNTNTGDNALNVEPNIPTLHSTGKGNHTEHAAYEDETEDDAHNRDETAFSH